MNVGDWNAARRRMEVDRTATRALRGGTTSMRSLGTVFLPMDFREEQVASDYSARLLRTFLFPAYDNAVRSHSSRPFQRAVQLTEADALLPSLQAIEHNCDREGTDLTTFAECVLADMIYTGLGLVMIDKPMVAVAEADGSTRPMRLDEELAADIRPYLVRIHPDNVLSWSWRRGPSGNRVLASLSVAETDARLEADGTEVELERVRYWTETTWQVLERESQQTERHQETVSTSRDLLMTAHQASQRTASSKDNPYRMAQEGVNALGRVPLVWRNVSPVGSDPLHAEPPMSGLAWKNIEDWQISSALSNNLHWHSYPVLQGSGVSHEEIDEGISYGAGAMILSSSDSFSLQFVETSGAAAQKLMERRNELREEMQQLGMAPMLKVQGGQTATGEAIDEVRSQSQAQSWVESLEWLLFESYRMAARWESPQVAEDELLPEQFDVSVFRDFGLVARSQQDLATLDAARSRRDISLETYLGELKKRAVLGEDVDIDEELQRLDAEGPALPAFPFPSPSAEGDDDDDEPATETDEQQQTQTA